MKGYHGVTKIVRCIAVYVNFTDKQPIDHIWRAVYYNIKQDIFTCSYQGKKHYLYRKVLPEKTEWKLYINGF